MSGIQELTNIPKNPVIVVGGGLAGLSAAHQAYMNGANVFIIDKQGFFGGNSTKATSGINGALTRTQVDLNIKDSVQQFYNDTIKSGKNQADEKLARVLTYESASAIEWLQDEFDLDLTLVSRLGGHSQPRTHRGKDAKFPGMAITYALMSKLEAIADKEPSRVCISKKSKLIDLIKEGNVCKGIVFLKNNKDKFKAYGPVVLATGGYAADFTSPDSLLKKYRPDVMALSTTNGNHATGDGQKLVIKNGGIGIDLEKVQVHPTGLVAPNDPHSKFKFLAGEALRGEGAIMLDATGKRFCNELGTRDYVSGEMTKVKYPIRLVLNSKSAKKLPFHVSHYESRGLMKKESGVKLAKSIGISESQLQSELDKYNKAAAYAAANPNSETIDPYGKKFFDGTPFNTSDTFHVSLIDRVVHFTMGGVKIDPNARVLTYKGDDKNAFEPILGLYAAGELAGNIHGHNRLGGSSLLACVCFGRVGGRSATNYLLKNLSNSTTGLGNEQGTGSRSVPRLNQIHLHLNPDFNGSLVVDFNNINAPNSTVPIEPNPKKESFTAPAESEPPKEKKKEVPSILTNKGFAIPAKYISLEELSKHNTESSCWIAVKNVVLDCTNFFDDHPGGKQSLMNFAGKDATKAFEMLHDDDVIPKYAASTVIGVLKGKKPELDI
ncbi:hypothetical protein DASC09_027020 [Saccharomycopsis crataegensis]|uniref:Cytochrome b5 heme-binding domain-containing protein n=1 Tax=Saccharomycopsis crataegensis TaxID=43959 RepID=A0AAV5QLF2_9ASCO|nr:hypothetical protein DASC09_027020 [Saccharomycopsis crataegensis]